MHYSLTDIQAEFEISRPVRYQITAKRSYFHGRQTDGRHDGRHDGRYDGRHNERTDRRRVRQQ